MSQHGYTLAQLASLLNAEIQGDPDCLITGIATLEQAQVGQITFLDNPRYRKYLVATQASAVIIKSEMLQECSTNALVMSNPYLGFAKAAALFDKCTQPTPGIHSSAVVAPDCQIHPTASIGANCVLQSGVIVEEGVVIKAGSVLSENVRVGAGSCLWPNVTLYHDVRIGERVIIHSGAVIGSDGFGLANDRGVWHKIPQLGRVVIGNDVEIGANTTIDRGTLNDTVIEEGVKLDNQIQVGHNVCIGAHTAIAGKVAIAGSARIGKYCMIGGASGISGHIEIADKVIITAMSMVTHSIKEAGIYSSGSPIQPNLAWRKNSARIRQLDDIARRVKQLEKILLNTVTKRD